MPRIPVLVLAALSPLMLAGCFPNPDYHDLPDQRVIGRRTEVLSAVTVADLAAPSADERAQVAAQLAAAGDTGVRVRVQLARTLARAPEFDLRRRLAELGVPSGIAVLDRRGDGEQTRLLIERTTLTAPDCSQMVTPNETWTFATSTYAAPRPQMSFGCATYTNLTRMVADPADLADPRAEGAPDGAYTAGAVQRYQDNAVTPLRKTTSTKSNGGNQ